MDNKKFETLINLIINEQEEQARELFHDIVVEKSREIYESIMDEEMMDGMEENMGGQVGDMMDEIRADEAGGMVEDDEDMELSDLDDDEVVDIDSDEVADEAGEDEVEDAVVRIEDKLDQLMAEFEEIMGGGEEGEEGAEDMGGEEGAEDMGGEEGGEEAPEEVAESEDDEDELDEDVMESVQLKQVPKAKMGDDGSNTKSPTLTKPKVVQTGANPVRFSGQAESVPNSPKAPSNQYTKGETQVKRAGSFKNAPAQSSQDLEKAPAPQKTSPTGINDKSVVAESRKVVKKVIRK